MLIAQTSSEATGGGFQLLMIIVIFGGLFLFMSLRQRRRLREREEFLSTVVVGDEVRTFGGVVGKVESLDDDEVILVSEGTRLRLVQAAIAARISAE
ncbi:MAG: preprotein translocase subunit YajC [Acidimicrobiia bacterium]|nr:preprotein translocase subunit YajC [Acidimicrobiia bacterium]